MAHLAAWYTYIYTYLTPVLWHVGPERIQHELLETLLFAAAQPLLNGSLVSGSEVA